MANRSSQNINQSGQSGKVAGLAVGIGAAGAASGFAAGYGGAAVYDKMHAPVDADIEEIEAEEPIAEAEYEDEVEAQDHSMDPVAEEHSFVGIEVNDVAVNIVPYEMDDIDPDQVTDELLAEELVDPNDREDSAMIEFASLDTVYDADGNAMTVAYARDTYENEEVALIDVDNDGTFDYILDANGGEYSLANSPLHYTVDDVEAQISDSTYLAATDAPANVLDNGDSYIDDIITV